MRTQSKWPMLVLYLEPNAIHAHWTKGNGTAKSTRVALSAGDWGHAWETQLRSFDDALIDVVTRLGIAPGTNTVVGFESPSAISEAQPLPAGDVHTGLASLRLAMCERLSLPRNSESVQIRLFGVASSSPDRSPVVISTGASDEHVETMTTWTSRAGLRLSKAVPAGAVLLGRLAGGFEGRQPDAGFRMLLHIDYHRCSIGVSTGDRIDLLRTFEIGLNNLAEAVVRASQGRDRLQGGPMTLGHATEVLMEHGIPVPGEAFGGEIGLSANAVLPLLQPVIQRLSIEIKQSARMVMRRSDTSTPRIHLEGPGSAVRGLTDGLMRSIDAEFVVSEEAGFNESIAQLMSRAGFDNLSLQSAHQLELYSQSRFRRAVICGGLLGMAVLGGEAAYYLHKDTSLIQEMAKLDVDRSRVQHFRDLTAESIDLNDRLGQADQLLDDHVGANTDWAATITHLANAAEHKVRITEIRGSKDHERGSLMIYGLADAREDSTDLTEFIAQLESSGLLSKVDVESRLLIELEGEPMYQFRLRASLVELRPQVTLMETSP